MYTYATYTDIRALCTNKLAAVFVCECKVSHYTLIHTRNAYMNVLDRFVRLHERGQND